MSGQTKKQLINAKSKKNEGKSEPLTQRVYYEKFFLNKSPYNFNYSNLINNIMKNKKLTSKCNTLKNSRKYI